MPVPPWFRFPSRPSVSPKGALRAMSLAVLLPAGAMAVPGAVPGLSILPAQAQEASSQTTGERPAVPVTTASVTEKDLPITLDVVGTILAIKDAPIQTAKADRIVQVLVKDGQRVSKGDVLFRLDDLAEQAQLTSANAELDVARKKLERTQELVKRNAAPRSQVPEDEAGVTQALARVDAAKVDLTHTEVLAPFNGVLSLLTVEEGDYTEQGKALATLYAMPPLQVLFEVPQRHLRKLAEGQPVSVWSSAYPESTATGAITVIDPAVNSLSRAVRVKALLDAPQSLRPGMFVSVSVTVEVTKGALLIPEGALVPTVKGLTVYTVADGKAQPVVVTTGQRKAGLVQVIGGLAAGDTVVVEGQQRLGPGSPVQVRAPANDGTAAPVAPAAKDGAG